MRDREPENRRTLTVETALGAVEIERDGSGPPVLVIHGTPGGSDAALALGRVITALRDGGG